MMRVTQEILQTANTEPCVSTVASCTNGQSVAAVDTCTSLRMLMATHGANSARDMPRSAPQGNVHEGITCPDSLDAPPRERKAPEWVLNQSRMRLRQTLPCLALPCSR